MTERRQSPFTSVRARFALAYAALLAGTGVALAGLIYSYLRYVPGYTAAPSMPAGSDSSTTPPMGPVPPGPKPLNNLILLALILLIISAAMWIGWLIAGRLLRPLDRITDAAIRAGRGELDHRIRLSGPNDEFATLAGSFDWMLERLQHSFDSHRRFAANASHELHTPLTVNKTMLQIALDDPESTDFVELARRLQRTNQHSIDTVGALLDLADINQDAIVRDQIDLGERTANLTDHVRLDAAAAEVGLYTDLEPASVYANSTLLSQLITNLLSNAVRHNLPGGAVWVRTRPAGDYACLRVANTGRQIAPNVAMTLTEPFVRSEGRTGTGASGRGLGLALAQSIVDAHDGRITLQPRHGGGLIVDILLPISDRGHSGPAYAA